MDDGAASGETVEEKTSSPELVVVAEQKTSDQKLTGKSKKDSLLGTIISERYLLQEVLSRGTTATVYKAKDQQEKRTVAVKIQ